MQATYQAGFVRIYIDSHLLGFRSNELNRSKMMNQLNGICFALLLVAVLIGNSGADLNEICKQPLPKDVDPTSCCKLPDSVDSSIVQGCSSRTFGLEDMHRESSNEPAFVPHFRVSEMANAFIHSKKMAIFLNILLFSSVFLSVL